MKQEPNSRGLGIPRLQAGEQVNENDMPPADPVLLASANRMLAVRLEEIYAALDVQMHSEALEAIKSKSIKRKPLYWIVAGGKHETEDEARAAAEKAAIDTGCNIPVCAVMAECEAVVKWKEAA